MSDELTYEESLELSAYLEAKRNYYASLPRPEPTPAPEPVEELPPEPPKVCRTCAHLASDGQPGCAVSPDPEHRVLNNPGQPCPYPERWEAR